MLLWFSGGDLSRDALYKLSEFDGVLFNEFINLYKNAPEVFYSILRTDMQFCLIDILKLTKLINSVK